MKKHREKPVWTQFAQHKTITTLCKMNDLKKKNSSLQLSMVLTTMVMSKYSK